MDASSNDPIAALRAEKRRRAVIILAVLCIAIVAFVLALITVTRKASSPATPLARFDVTSTPRRVQFSVSDSGSVALWIEIEQEHRDGHKSTSPTRAAELIVESRGRTMTCDPTDVVMVADWTRSGRVESWRGKLASCELGRLDAGQHAIGIHWQRSGDAPDEVELRSVALIPSREGVARTAPN